MRDVLGKMRECGKYIKMRDFPHDCGMVDTYARAGHDFTLVKGQSRLDFRKYSFCRRTVNEWNNLPADCMHSSSVNVFKDRIDNYLVRARYT